MKNMKIEINEQQPLEDVVRELERLGFKPFRMQSEKPIIVYVKKCGKYFASAGGTCIGYFKLTTLAELRSMSVEQLKEM